MKAGPTSPAVISTYFAYNGHGSSEMKAGPTSPAVMNTSFTSSTTCSCVNSIFASLRFL